jgi:hypothetical protein
MFEHNPTIQGPLNNFIASLFTAGTSLVQAVVALFYLIWAFGHFWIDKFVQLVQTCIQVVFDLLRGVTGFIVGMSIKVQPDYSTDISFLIANFFILLILGGGGYYWWSTRTQSGKGRRRIK